MSEPLVPSITRQKMHFACPSLELLVVYFAFIEQVSGEPKCQESCGRKLTLQLLRLSHLAYSFVEVVLVDRISVVLDGKEAAESRLVKYTTTMV